MSRPQKKYKLALITSHVIQYGVPLYKKINAHPDIELTVFFCSDQGLAPVLKDTGFGIRLQWDTITLEGLNYKFLKNSSPFATIDSFFGVINFGIFRELRKAKYDAIIVVGYAKLTYWMTIAAAYLTGTPLVLSGEPPTPWRPKIRKIVMGFIKMIVMPRLLSYCSGVLYIGKKSKEFYLHYNPRIEHKLFFYPYSVDNEYYFSKAEEYKGKREELKKEYGIPSGYPVILFLSKLIYWKRPLLLLEAYSQLKIPAVLVYVGSGVRSSYLKKYAAHHNLERVYFFGFQNYSQVPKFYSIADIFILPSLGESWGLAINEAMCFGLPVITTDRVMSSYDLVKDGENGFVIARNDLSALVSSLTYLLGHPEKRKQMGEESRRIIRGWNYDLDVRACLDVLAVSRHTP